MTIDQLARTLKARREGKNYRAKCPVHKSRGLSLGLYPKKTYTQIVCYAGCSSDDVLSAIGLTVSDLYYIPRTNDPAQKKEWAKKQWLQEQADKAERRLDLQRVIRAVERNKRPAKTEDTFGGDIEKFVVSMLARESLSRSSGS